MPTSLYNSAQSLLNDDNDETSLFLDPSLSPTAALFPPELSAPYMNLPLNDLNNFSGNNLNMSSGYMDQGRLSISSFSDITNMSNQQQTYPYSLSTGSRPPSLSPRSQTQPISISSHSPSLQSSASPSSNFSLSATDDFLLPQNAFNSFSASELDMLFLQEPSEADVQSTLGGQNKPGQSLFLPSHRSTSGNLSADLTSADLLQNIFNTSSLGTAGQPQPRDDTFDMLNLVNASPIPTGRQRESVADMAYSFPNQQPISNTSNGMQSYQQPQNTIPPQWMSQQVPMDSKSAQIKQEAWPIDMVNDFGNKQALLPSQSSFVNLAGNSDPFTMEHGSFDEIGAQFAQRRASPVKGRPAPAQQHTAFRTGSASKAAGGSIAEVPTVGKHNKTERRYRQKVQAAQADLRDSIPALRVLYGTSTDDQKRTTDFRAADGTVDGLGEVTRPNASAKATILIAARVYIELLQRRSATLQRKVNELEQFRSAVAGEDDLRSWREQFDAKERELQAQIDANAKVEEGSSDEEEEVEDEDDEPKRKKPRTAAPPKAPKAKPGPKGKKNAPGKKDEDPSAGSGGAGSGLRVFAAFAMSFSLVPSASNILKHAPATEVGATDQVFSGSASTGQVLARLPLITAEHTSRLLARHLPNSVVPTGHTLVDWTWRLIIAIILAVSIGPILARFTRDSADSKPKAGSLSGVIQDCTTLVKRRGGKAQSTEDTAQWDRTAGEIIGGTVTPSVFAKWHTILHLNGSAQTAYSLALLALLQPELPLLRSPELIWHDAHSMLRPTSPPALAAVLHLPLHEAIRCLETLPPTSSPIAAIAEQINLVHIYDLYSRFFIRLVDASTNARGLSDSTSLGSLLANLETCNLRANFRSSAFDKEIRGVIECVSKSSAAHALGLVLVGLWGVFTGPTPSAQAALAASLAAEEVKGAGNGLSSVSAMLELLYPGSTKNQPALERTSISRSLPPNAQAVDKLALACIDYIQLLTSASGLNDQSSTRLQRLEASQHVQKATARLRLVLTQTKFVGLDEEHLDEYDNDDVYNQGDSVEAEEVRDIRLESESKKFEQAKEKLVNVLCQVGRRAAGRAAGRDEDSGLEGDLDEL